MPVHAVIRPDIPLSCHYKKVVYLIKDYAPAPPAGAKNVPHMVPGIRTTRPALLTADSPAGPGARHAQDSKISLLSGPGIPSCWMKQGTTATRERRLERVR
jgi:hypothetical protein